MSTKKRIGQGHRRVGTILADRVECLVEVFRLANFNRLQRDAERGGRALHVFDGEGQRRILVVNTATRERRPDSNSFSNSNRFSSISRSPQKSR